MEANCLDIFTNKYNLFYDIMIIEVVLILLILYLLIDDKEDGMTSDVKHEYARHILNNEYLFSNHGTLQLAKTKFNWIDPVIYEDVRDAFRSGKFNESNIINILSI
jgi:hypothetical protein